MLNYQRVDRKPFENGGNSPEKKKPPGDLPMFGG
jgi:hypothetical protein